MILFWVDDNFEDNKLSKLSNRIANYYATRNLPLDVDLDKICAINSFGSESYLSERGRIIFSYLTEKKYTKIKRLIKGDGYDNY